MDTPHYNVLFLCTGNSARSIIAEAILNQKRPDLFSAYSAGSHPAGRINDAARALLERMSFSTAGLRSKSWAEFAGEQAPELHFVFTVCDSAAAETCPTWPGQPMTAHWGVPDPAQVVGTDIERINAMRDAFRVLERRIDLFVNLPIASLDALILRNKLDDIGRA